MSRDPRSIDALWFIQPIRTIVRTRTHGGVDVTRPGAGIGLIRLRTGEGFFIDLDEAQFHFGRLRGILDEIFECGTADSLLAHPGRLRHVTTAQVGHHDATTRSTFGALNTGFYPADELSTAHEQAHEAILTMAVELKSKVEAIHDALSATIDGYCDAEQDLQANVTRAHEDLRVGR